MSSHSEQGIIGTPPIQNRLRLFVKVRNSKAIDQYFEEFAKNIISDNADIGRMIAFLDTLSHCRQIVDDATTLGRNKLC